ncbi:MAG: RidA family protein [candidate division KSB1 bacterium]|nr:RidA family protein [candidate division KSB1 bacterium]MDZ7385142.1 RidA family protein [candidate division KSB1 bacterium]MDZ7391570.1 RidA family protein [candidate division KSB1 bacterium]MDZ7413769.1 RidA family protein [candidate division KSB1 bacterium]
MKTVVATGDAPKAIGPYSQAVLAGTGLVFTAGQLGLDPRTGELVGPGIKEQTQQALTNLAAVLRAAGSSLERVVKTTVFLADLNDFAAMNEVYAQFFPTDPPARSAVQVARLPKDARVEIEAVAERA